MPKAIEENTTLSIEDLQEAIKGDAFGNPPVEQDEVEPGEDLTHQGEELSEEPVEPEQEPEEPVEEPEEPEKPDHRVLTMQELEQMFVKGKVMGEEREYSLKELLAIKQTQDAAKLKLDEYKELLRSARESLKQEQPKQEPKVEEEYLTEEEKRVRTLETEFNNLRQHQRKFEESSLVEAEERHMRSVFERDGLSDEAAATRLKQIVETYPDAAEFARDLFTTNPASRDELNKRIKTFNTLWHLGKTIEMPEVVQRGLAEAEQKGRTQAKIDAKRGLADTKQGQVDMREPTREEKLRELAKKKSDDAFAQFMLENSVVLKNYE